METKMELKNIIRPEIINQRAYQVAETVGSVKLDANENPFSLAPELRQKLFARFQQVDLHRYPELGSVSLIRRLAATLQVPAEMVIVGNGSDELISLLCAATGIPGSVTLLPSPTFVMYRISAANYGHKVIEAPLDSNFNLNVDAVRDQIRINRPSLIFLSYPNNPTGNCFRREEMETIIHESPGLVVVDEAYFHFSGQTFLPLLSTFDNLLILRSFSKIGLAAMRLGMLVGNPVVVREINKVRPPYNLDSFAQIAAEFFLDHEPEFLRQTREIMGLRNALLKELATIKIVKAFPTDANFVFFRCTIDADLVYAALLRRGIIIRNLSSPGPLAGCLRVTVGTGEENLKFLESLKEIEAELG